MVSAMAVLSSSGMVMICSALASSSWARMVSRAPGFDAFLARGAFAFSALGAAAFVLALADIASAASVAVLALGALRLAAAFGAAAFLRAAVFFAGAFRGLVLFPEAGLHPTVGHVLLGDNAKQTRTLRASIQDPPLTVLRHGQPVRLQHSLPLMKWTGFWSGERC